MDDLKDISGAERSSYQFSGDRQAAIRNGAIAVLYDFLNGEETKHFFFSETEVKDAEKQYADSNKYSVEYLED